MSIRSNKKVITTASNKTAENTSNSTRNNTNSGDELLFGKTNYLWIAGGFAIIFLGMILMMGGHMPSEDVWDDNLIYSSRRTVIAPIVILGGLVVGGLGIFKK